MQRPTPQADRVVYSARCSWWGTPETAGRRGSGLPVCPFCGSPLFETSSAEWEASANAYASKTEDPAYPEFVRWLRGRGCYSETGRARQIFDAEKRTNPAKVAEAIAASSTVRPRHLEAVQERPARAARRHRGKVPAVPGVLADRRPATINDATAEAHRVLPFVPGTSVHLLLCTPEEGLARVAQLFGPEARVTIADLLQGLPATAEMPTVTIASRTYRKESHR